MTDREREAQAAAIKEAAAKITGTPRTDPAGRAAQWFLPLLSYIAKKSAEGNSRRAQQMAKGKKPATAEQLINIEQNA